MSKLHNHNLDPSTREGAARRNDPCNANVRKSNNEQEKRLSRRAFKRPQEGLFTYSVLEPFDVQVFSVATALVGSRRHRRI